MITTKTTHKYNSHLFIEPLPLGGVKLSPSEMLEHVLATGGTGSGKTRCFLLPLVEQTLKRFGNSEVEKAGMFLIDAKGDMADFAVSCARRSGRHDDIYILGEGGNCWFPLFDQFDGDATKIASFLFETLEDRTSKGSLSRGGSNDSYWEENTRRLLRASVIMAKATFGSGMDGLEGISECVNQILSLRNMDDDDDNDASKFDGFQHKLPKVYSGYNQGWITTYELGHFEKYIKNDVVGGNARTWSTIANMTRNYIEQFSQPALLEIFKPDPTRRKVSPEAIIDQGLLLIVNLSPCLYGDVATSFRVAIKKAFCQRVLQRNHLSIVEDAGLRKINQTRPILYVCDEFHTTISAGNGVDSGFLDRAREFGCMCILATQGISAVKSVLANEYLVDHLLNNIRTKFFFANDCPVTSNYFEKLGGDEDRCIKGISYQPHAAPPRFLLPNHDFTQAEEYRIMGISIDTQRRPKFCSAKLGKLPNGTAYVVSKGRVLQQYTHSPSDYGNANVSSLSQP